MKSGALLALVLTASVSSINCQTVTGYDPGLRLVIEPKEISPTHAGGMTRWDFDIILYNDTSESVLLGPIYDRVFDTDTGFTATWSHYGPKDNWHGLGQKVAVDGMYKGHHYLEHSAFYSGMYEFLMTATDLDGKKRYKAVALVLLRE